MVDSPMVHSARLDSARVDSPTIDCRKLEYPRIDSPTIDCRKLEYPKLDSPTKDHPRVDSPRAEYPTVEYPSEFSSVRLGRRRESGPGSGLRLGGELDLRTDRPVGISQQGRQRVAIGVG